jgi:hypothetical protein
MVQTITLLEEGGSPDRPVRWRVECPAKSPRHWGREELEQFVSAVCLCIGGRGTPSQLAGQVRDTVAYWSITHVENNQFTLTINNEGREWSSADPLPLMTAVRAFGAEEAEDGAGGDLQLTDAVLKRAQQLARHDG